MKDKINCDIGFIILHYNAIAETIACVESIQLKLKDVNHTIVIVDNASLNKSGEELFQLYSNKYGVNVLLSDSNLGFANGNNLGYRYLLENFTCNFVCMLNNDTIIMDDDFYFTIEEEYKQSNFAVLGPLIVLNDGEYNPKTVGMPSKKEVQNSLYKLKVSRYINYIGLRPFILSILSMFKKSMKQDYSVFERSEHALLHGCCLIYSQVYLTLFEDALDPRTFMFREEELLMLRLQQHDLNSVYNPKLRIRHFEDASTDSTYNSSRSKSEFIFKNSIDSTYVILDQYEKGLKKDAKNNQE